MKSASSLDFPDKPLRGEAKLNFAIDKFAVDVTGKTALDVGASAGGFTKVLLQRGAKKVYAVDVGYGQLLGSLRQNPQVINLENTNVAKLDTRIVPETLDVIAIDVSYLQLGVAVSQLENLKLTPGATLLGLVKPMFELKMATAPTDLENLRRAAQVATQTIGEKGWIVRGFEPSPVLGAKGALEGFIHASFG